MESVDGFAVDSALDIPLVALDVPIVDAPSDASGDVRPDVPIMDVGNDIPDAGSGPMCGLLGTTPSLMPLVAAAPTEYGTNHQGAQPFTLGYEVTADIMAGPGDFNVPMDCVGCSILLSVRGSVPGVTQAEGSVRISMGAQLRLRFNNAGGVANIYFEPPCTEFCPAGMTQCPEDGSCFGAGADMCIRCGGRSQARCACVDDMQRRLPNGSLCMFGEVTDGRCVDGECIGVMM